VIRLKCLACGLAVPYNGSQADHCPRCFAREHRIVGLVQVSDRPSVPHQASMGRLTVATSSEGARYTVALTGELDLGSAAVLEDTLGELCAAGATEVLVDMAGVEFIDSSGMNAILRSRALCEEHGCQLHLTPAQRPAQHALKASGLRDRLSFRKGSTRESP
jgi:anti-anti-sigma factor